MCIHKGQERDREVIKDYLQANMHPLTDNFISKDDLEVCLAYYYNQPIKISSVSVGTGSYIDFKGLKIKGVEE